MFRVSSRVSAGFRLVIVSLAAAVAILSVTSDGAEARRKQRHASKSHVSKTHVAKSRAAGRVKKARARHGGGASAYNPAAASIVVDANSGKLLEATNPDSLRHPASLTKIMTLYLLFERLEAGKMNLYTEMKVSEHASEQAPTKLGLKPGQTLAVEDAIKGLVTKSANDAAVVVAEAIGNSEEEFARLMTAKARSIGMSRTVYRNASGLPDDEQVTTARDQALLGRAIRERYPRYYKYFATQSFRYRGLAMRNHNKLLGQVEGVDGIKTGYTHSSGFNLVTSVKRGNRHIVAVVLGGRSAGSRDARMRNLIEEHIAEASGARTATAVAARDEERAPANATTRTDELTEQPARQRLAQATTAAATTPASLNERFVDNAPTAAISPPRPAPGSDAPIKPVRVKTVAVKTATQGSVQGTALTPLQIAPVEPIGMARAKPSLPAPAAVQGEVMPAAAPAPARTHVVSTAPSLPVQEPAAEPVAPARAASTPAAEVVPLKTAAAPAVAPAPKSLPEPVASERKIARSGWSIQIGAFEAEGEARDKLSSAQSKVKDMLGRADPYTETVNKGDKTLYRARFAGFDRDGAEAACKALKKNEFQCMALKN
jgi:D-alanyl-D-alanine carboxypeptidase